ncbi:MAG TPA: gliding motility-associated C-terminal domain-containing protein [Puia sp.]|jgi:gliding motility-associated-like protein|nr:gliding motility-associated C-terminal domain-containing protein [Puia sp.]
MLQRHYPHLGKASFRIQFAIFLLVAGICKGQPTVTVAITNPTCAYNNGSFLVTATGGTSPYYFVSNAARESNSTGIFGGLAAGTYDVTVRDLKGKQTTTTVVLTSPGTFPYYTPTVVDATGCNTNNGQVTLTPAGGTPPYQYSINDGATFQSGNVFSNLAPGSYGILIKDANGCVTAPWSATGVSYADFQLWSHASFVNITASNCPLAMSATPSAPACGNNNSITITGTSGGTAPYLYSIDGGAPGPLTGGGFSGLSPGGHTVTVQDATGLKASYSYTFPNDCSITTSQTPSQCTGSTGTLTVTGASGIPPLSYSIDGKNYQAGATFSGLAAGTYTIMVKDAYGVVTYGSGNVVAVCFAAVATTTASQCNMSTGTITAKGVNGFPPYSYSIDGVTFQASAVFNNLKGGYYLVTITDSHGETAKTTTVVQDQCMTLVATPQTASCGNPNGSLSVAASNGTAPYKYSLSAGNFYQTSNVFTALPTGFYSVTVEDANGNLATVPAVVGEVQGPQISTIPTAASCQNNDGAVQITTTGGTSPFQISFDGGAYTAGQTSWKGLDTGTHSIAITDNNGCQTSATVLVPLDDTLTITEAPVPATCQGVGVTLQVASNANGASFMWTPADGLSNSNIADPVAQPSATTTYTVTATLGVCARDTNVDVTVLPAPVAAAGEADTICPGKSAQLQGSGGIQYQWSPGTYLSDSTSADPTVDQPASTVTYHLTVKGANGCASINPAGTTVVVTPQPKVFAGDDTAVVIGEPLQLNAVDVDSSGFTAYIWSPAEGLSDPNVANPTTVVTGDVTYSVVATTSFGCSATGKIVVSAVNKADILVPNAFTPNNDGHNDLLKVTVWGVQLKYFRVYNRWGQLVFSSADAGMGWDGSVGGQLAPTGTYVWMAGGIDDHGRPVTRTGTAILIR